MEAKAKERNIRMPARKIRRIINEVRGKSVREAMKILKFMPYFAAKRVAKNINDATANASEKWGVSADELIVSEIFADEGVTYKRARPRAQGRIYRIEKKTSHLTVKVKVDETLKQKLAEAKKAKKAKTKKASTKKETVKEETKATEAVETKVEVAEVKEEAPKTEPKAKAKTEEVAEAKTEEAPEAKAEETSKEEAKEDNQTEDK